MNEFISPSEIAIDIYRVLAYILLLFTTLTILAILYDKDPPQPK